MRYMIMIHMIHNDTDRYMMIYNDILYRKFPFLVSKIPPIPTGNYKLGRVGCVRFEIPFSSVQFSSFDRLPLGCLLFTK